MSELVSVVVATYRRSESLRTAIESIMMQTYDNIEIIVVDDNGDQQWNQTVAEIVSKFSQVKCVCNETNLGSAKARNAGVQVSTGTYITFLDDDDLYLPEKVAHQLYGMKAEDADFSITDLDLYNETEKLVEKRTRGYIDAYDPNSLLKYHLMYHMTGTDTMMFRRSYLTEIGGFPPIDVGDEFYLMSCAIEAGGKFAYVPGCYVKAYVHTGDGGLSSGQGKIDGENALFAYKKTLFGQMDRKTQSYIKMRHYAVLAYAYLRMGKLGAFLVMGCHAFFCSPLGSCKLLTNRGIAC